MRGGGGGRVCQARQKEGLSCGSRPLLPLQPRYGSPVAFPPLVSGEGLGWCGEGVVEVVLLALSLERASQFIKAFGERGRNLHVT